PRAAEYDHAMSRGSSEVVDRRDAEGSTKRRNDILDNRRVARRVRYVDEKLDHLADLILHRRPDLKRPPRDVLRGIKRRVEDGIGRSCGDGGAGSRTPRCP